MNRSLYVGIDPGQSGGISVLDRKGRCVATYVMPLRGKEIDAKGLSKLLRQYMNKKVGGTYIAQVVIEHVGVMPGQGGVAGFTFGTGWGMLRGVCDTMRLPTVLVRPQKWKREILPEYLPERGPKAKRGHAVKKTKQDKAQEKKAQKEASIQFCRDTWPKTNLIPPRCRTPHDGLADSLAMAEYARRLANNELRN